MLFKFRCAKILLAIFFVSPTSLADGAESVSVGAQISEGINLSGGVRAAVTEFWHSHGRFPVDNAEAGISQPYEITGRYVLSVTVTGTDGIISVDFGFEAAEEIFGRTIEMIPTIVSREKVRWSCSAPYIPSNLLPATCNGAYVPLGI